MESVGAVGGVWGRQKYRCGEIKYIIMFVKVWRMHWFTSNFILLAILFSGGELLLRVHGPVLQNRCIQNLVCQSLFDECLKIIGFVKL